MEGWSRRGGFARGRRRDREDVFFILDRRSFEYIGLFFEMREGDGEPIFEESVEGGSEREGPGKIGEVSRRRLKIAGDSSIGHGKGTLSSNEIRDGVRFETLKRYPVTIFEKSIMARQRVE